MDIKSGEGGLNWEAGVDRLGNPLQYSRLENPMARGAWQATAQGNRKSRDTTEQLNHHHNIYDYA